MVVTIGVWCRFVQVGHATISVIAKPFVRDQVRLSVTTFRIWAGGQPFETSTILGGPSLRFCKGGPSRMWTPWDFVCRFSSSTSLPAFRNPSGAKARIDPPRGYAGFKGCATRPMIESMAFAKCIYCGAEENLTVDHVPPKLLLMGPPYPENIVKVPACFFCNQSFQKDDEYIRTLLVTDSRATKNTSAQSKLPAVLRSLQRPDARGFVEYLASQAIPNTILKPDGSPMAQAFKLDQARVNRAGERFIRAFYFAEVGTPLPAKAIIKVGARTDLRPADADAITIARAMQVLPDWREKIIGTAFNYLAAIGPGVSFWLMNLYEFFFWAGTVDFRDTLAEKSN
jgi:hypothetical protein